MTSRVTQISKFQLYKLSTTTLITVIFVVVVKLGSKQSFSWCNLSSSECFLSVHFNFLMFEIKVIFSDLKKMHTIIHSYLINLNVLMHTQARSIIFQKEIDYLRS